MTKSELGAKYKLGRSTLQRLLNERYYEELVVLGYEKDKSLLPPIVVRKFMELYGEPIKNDEI